MGIENRDYYRDGSYTSSFSSFDISTWPPVCKWLIFANVIIYVMQVVITRPMTGDEYRQMIQDQQAMYQQDIERLPPEMQDEFAEEMVSADDFEMEYFDGITGMNYSVVQKWFELDPRKIKRGQVWRLVTCAFCHDRYGYFHILFNMIFLYWFGRTLEMMYGSREFLFFYFAAVIISSLAFFLLALQTGDMIPAIGASGAVMAIVVLFAMHFPRHQVFTRWFFPIEIRWLVLMYVLYDVHPVLLALSGENYYDGVGHAAHLGGLAFGFAYWYSGVRVTEIWDSFSLPQFGKAVGVRPSPELDKRNVQRVEKIKMEVDSILEQISNDGMDSLSDEQKEFLDRASKKYKRDS